MTHHKTITPNNTSHNNTMKKTVHTAEFWQQVKKEHDRGLNSTCALYDEHHLYLCESRTFRQVYNDANGYFDIAELAKNFICNKKVYENVLIGQTVLFIMYATTEQKRTIRTHFVEWCIDKFTSQ